MYKTAISMLIIERSVIVIASVGVLALITCYRKRTEFLYIMCPLSFLLSGVFGIWYAIRIYTSEYIG